MQGKTTEVMEREWSQTNVGGRGGGGVVEIVRHCQTLKLIDRLIGNEGSV